MKFKIVLIVFVVLYIISCNSNNSSTDIKKYLLGVWFHEENGKFQQFDKIENSPYELTTYENFSWGKSLNIAYSTLVIDYIDNILTFNKSPGYFRVKKIKNNGRIFNVKIFWFSDDLPKEQYEYIDLEIKISDKYMFIKSNNKLFSGTYYKIGGPEIK